MLSIVISKPVIGLIGALTFASPVAAIVFLKEDVSIENFNEVILIEETNKLTYKELSDDEMLVKCKLEDSETLDFCSLGKINNIPAKTWVDMNEFIAFGIDSQIKKNGFITEDKTIYRARVSLALIKESINKPTKKLQIFNGNKDADITKPLITLKTTFSTTKEKGLIGKMEYVLGRVAYSSTPQTNKLTTTNTHFTCVLPGMPNVYKNCEFYLFDKEQKASKSFYDSVLVNPLQKATTIESGVHYLIKFETPVDVTNARYIGTVALTINAFTDKARTTPSQSTITNINMKELSPFAFINGNEKIDLALVV